MPKPRYRHTFHKIARVWEILCRRLFCTFILSISRNYFLSTSKQVVVYNSDGCVLMNPGDQQHQPQFKIMADNLEQLRALIERLKGEAESRDKENNGDGPHELTDEHSKEASREFDETSNDTQLPNDESSNGGKPGRSE